MDAVPPSAREPLPPAPAPARRHDAWLAFALALLVLAAPAGTRDLWDADEGRYAAVALDMRRSGDFVTPREDGMRFLDKPPLVYWAENGAFSLLGTNAFAARLPCVVAGAALAALAFLFASAWASSRAAGFCAAGVAATSLAGAGFSRTVTMDMPLAACVGGALWFAWRALSVPGLRARLGLGLCVGLGLLAKGPLAAALPAVVAVAWGACGVRWGPLLRVAFSPVAWAVALVVAAPWYALVERANPGYLRHFVLYEHVGRMAEKGNRDFAPFWLYAAVLPAFLFPWTHLLWRARLPSAALGGRKGPVSGSTLAWAWVLACLVLFSAGKNRLFTYILPAALPLFALAGARFAAVLEGGAAGARRLAAWAAAQGALVVAAGAALGTGLVGRWLRVPDARWEALGGSVATAPVTLLFLAGVVAFGMRASPPWRRGLALVAGAAALWVILDVHAGRADELRSPRRLADRLAEEYVPGDAIVCLDVFPQGLRWYADLDFAVAGRQREIVRPWADEYAGTKLLTVEELRALWDSPRRVLLVVREAKAPPWRVRPAHTIADRLSGGQRSDLVLLENRPRDP
jgi:4-amino-4-deoxy-L-arabinose transferase-like glycosyltransferase